MSANNNEKTTLTCGKFGEKLPLSPPHEKNPFKVVRTIIPRIKPIKLQKTVIGVDSQSVYYNGRKTPLPVFLLNSPPNSVITLTNKEANILLKSGLLTNINITSFEKIYPWVAGIKFIADSKKNYIHLNKLFHKYRKHLATSGEFADDALKRVISKVKWKSELDQYFYSAQSHPYQDTFKFTEARKNRKIFALDFNSMYGACLEGGFPNPKQLVFTEFMKEANTFKTIHVGIYKCTLSNPKNLFIKKFHSLKYNTTGQKFGFVFGDKISVDVLLHKEEIDYFKNHFESLFIRWGVISKEPIQHPLAKIAKQAYLERSNFKSQQNKSLEGKCKFQIATLYSCVAQRKSETNTFSTLAELLKYLEDKYHIVKPQKMSGEQFANFIIRLPAFNIQITDAFILTSPRMKHKSNIFSLYSPVIAKARVKVMECLEYISKFKDAEICYSNVDSIHVSIPSKYEGRFLSFMAPRINDKCGGLKIETIADKGVWFEPGKYWLFSGNQVVKFRNKGIRGKHWQDPFTLSKKYIIPFKYKGSILPKVHYINFMQSLSYRRKIVCRKNLQHIEFDRFRIEEISSPKNWLSSLSKETLNSAKLKHEVFSEMQNW